RRGARLAGLVVLAAGAVVLAGCGAATTTGKFTAADTPARRMSVALAQLAGAPGVRVAGTIVDEAGENLAVDVRMLDSGEGRGTIDRVGKRAEVLVVEDGTYLRAPAAWWGSDARAQLFKNVWVKVPETEPGLDLATAVTPSTLGKRLRTKYGQTRLGATRPPVSTADGVEVEKISTPEGDLYVTTGKPHRVARVVGKVITGADPSGSRSADLTVTPADEDQAAAVAADVANGARGLAGGAYDSRVRIESAGKVSGACDAAGCTMRWSIKNASGGEVNVVMRASVHSNRELGNCITPPKPARPDTTVALTCRLTSKAWTDFYRTATAPSSAARRTPYTLRATGSAVFPAPKAASCRYAAGKTPAGCPDLTVTPEGLDRAADQYAAAWFGKVTATDAEKADYRQLVERAASARDCFPWTARVGSASAQTTACLSEVGGKQLAVQYDRATGKLVTAFPPSDKQLAEMRRALAGK
ncbi:MAG TPA: hypothetical protein VGR21_08890, partial [Cryptosporangiaceae bacterium]|nr:hypothetical protein [Cryptosporangiaceae bacterium]